MTTNTLDNTKHERKVSRAWQPASPNLRARMKRPFHPKPKDLDNGDSVFHPHDWVQCQPLGNLAVCGTACEFEERYCRVQTACERSNHNLGRTVPLLACLAFYISFRYFAIIAPRSRQGSIAAPLVMNWLSDMIICPFD